MAGIAQAVAASGTSLYLARAVDRRRLGLAFGVRQAAAPAATILAGLCVPLVAGDTSWRWPFAVAAVLSVLIALATPGLTASQRVVPTGATSAPRRLMVRLAVGAGFATVSTVALATFLVDSAVLAGVPNGRAGVVVAASGLVGLVMRLVSGIHADRRDGGNLVVVSRMLYGATIVFVLLSLERANLFYLAAPLAFSASWGYQALLQLAIVRGNTAHQEVLPVSSTAGASSARSSDLRCSVGWPGTCRTRRCGLPREVRRSWPPRCSCPSYAVPTSLAVGSESIRPPSTSATVELPRRSDVAHGCR